MVRIPWRPWLAGSVAVTLSATVAILLVRSWAADWADFGFVGSYDRFRLYTDAGAAVAGGAALLYLVGWIVFPSLPPHDYDGDPDLLRRRDRLMEVRVWYPAAILVVIAVGLYGAWSTLHPCEGLSRCVTGTSLIGMG